VGAAERLNSAARRRIAIVIMDHAGVRASMTRKIAPTEARRLQRVLGRKVLL
jgi:hypothetical protein